MNYLLLLTVVYFAFLLYALVVSRGKILSPSVIFFCSFSVMLIFANVFQWDFKFQIKAETVGIMTIAGAIFLLTEYLYRAFVYTVRGVPQKHKEINGFDSAVTEKPHPIIIQNVLLNFFTVFMIACVLFALINLIRNSAGGASWNAIIHNYRMSRIYTRGADAWRYTVISQLSNLVLGLVYINTYILIFNKWVCGIPLLHQKRAAFIDLLYVPFVLIGSGGRQGVVELVVFIVLCVILFALIGYKKLKIGKLILGGGILLTVFIIAFTETAAFVGRVDIYRNPLIYVAEYLCGGLYNFNAAIGKSFTQAYWGGNTFANIYAFLNKFGIIPDQAVLYFHAVGWSGLYSASTTVTTYGRWYEDFGACGVYIMTALVSLFFSWLFYSKVLPSIKPNIFHIVFTHQLMALVWASYDDRIYALLSMSNLIKIFWLAVFFWLLVGDGRKYVFTFGKQRIRLRHAPKQAHFGGIEA